MTAALSKHQDGAQLCRNVCISFYVLHLLSNFQIHQKLDQLGASVNEKTTLQRCRQALVHGEKLILCKSV